MTKNILSQLKFHYQYYVPNRVHENGRSYKNCITCIKIFRNTLYPEANNKRILYRWVCEGAIKLDKEKKAKASRDSEGYVIMDKDNDYHRVGEQLIGFHPIYYEFSELEVLKSEFYHLYKTIVDCFLLEEEKRKEMLNQMNILLDDEYKIVMEKIIKALQIILDKY